MSGLVRRRLLLAIAGLAAPGLGFGRHPARGAAQDVTPEVGDQAGQVGQVETPRWIFTVLTLEDPYTGEITRPDEPVAGMRYLAALVAIDNASDQPLEFSSSDIKLRDEQGVEYPAGSVSGREPRLASQNLPGGFRTQGSVWFALPEDAVAVELKLNAPSPQLRVPLTAQR